jgi:NADP-dependent 3-hydroxy acid dehydrogenase YdfG
MFTRADISMQQPGMGEALARDLVSRGWKVCMADINRNETLLTELADNSIFCKTDVADYDSQAQTFEATFEKWGRIDALCANAGIVDRRLVSRSDLCHGHER